MIVILDPGHGLSNRRAGVFDPGAVADGFRESDIVMIWANEIRECLHANGYRTIRTRINNMDPAPLAMRSSIAKEYMGEVMLSLHCNAANGTANGTETFFRGESNRKKAQAINDAVCAALGTRNRKAKLESESQHERLAVMEFQPCFLLEIGFIDHTGDRSKMLDSCLRKQACEKIAKILVGQ